jgi:hypothetical protein
VDREPDTSQERPAVAPPETDRSQRRPKLPPPHALRPFLEANEVYFRTLAALCLVVTSIVVAYRVNSATHVAKQVLDRQTQIMERQGQPDLLPVYERRNAAAWISVVNRGGRMDDVRCDASAVLRFAVHRDGQDFWNKQMTEAALRDDDFMQREANEDPNTIIRLRISPQMESRIKSLMGSNIRVQLGAGEGGGAGRLQILCWYVCVRVCYRDSLGALHDQTTALGENRHSVVWIDRGPVPRPVWNVGYYSLSADGLAKRFAVPSSDPKIGPIPTYP